MGTLKTIRHRLIEALKERLEEFEWSEIEPTVYVGRVMFDPETDPLPVVTVVPGVEESQRTRYGSDLRTMPIDVSALISLADGADATGQGEPIFGELHEAVFDGGDLELTFGEGKDEETRYATLEYRGGGIAEYPNDLGPAVLTIAVSVAVTFDTATGNPFNKQAGGQENEQPESEPGE